MTFEKDDEYTYVPGRGRVRKSLQVLEAFGTIDELNSLVGYAAAVIKETDINTYLKRVQECLFNIGSYLAVRNHPLDTVAKGLDELRIWSEGLKQGLPPLRRFIYPAGSVEACLLHLCRAVARRAEREVVRLTELEEVDKVVVSYLNMLSTFLFIAARALNFRRGFSDEEWVSV
jgi:cob(I)alamin adenosyltransferase